MSYDTYDTDIEEMKAEQRLMRRYQSQLIAHYSCRDPEHPGCERCEETQEEEENVCIDLGRSTG